MYLDTDVILAVLKEDDWLKSEVDLSGIKEAKTSAITITEIQLVYDDWSQRFGGITEKLRELDIEILDVTPEIIEKSSKLQQRHSKLNVFDSLHLAHAEHLEEAIVSTDTLFPEIPDIESRDPRNMK